MALKAFLLVTALFVLLAAPGPARAGGPTMLIGATEDAVRQPTLVGAKGQMDLLALAGFNAVRVTQVWTPGDTKPSADDLRTLRNVEQAGRLDGVQVLLAVMNFGSRTTPLTEEARGQFADYTAALARALPQIHYFVIGNEPNLNRYWLPQFNPDGSDAAAPAYEALLEQAYDSLKAVSAKIFVLGGALSPRGGDDPTSTRQTHSPTAFITDLGAAYRASGRTRPIMDGFAFHPYGENSSTPPDFLHPRSTSIGLGDYPKLVALLARAFNGTPQLGSRLPIVYDEYGIDSLIPVRKSGLYHGREPASTRPVPEGLQAVRYSQALLMAACQPTVRGFLIFHVTD